MDYMKKAPKGPQDDNKKMAKMKALKELRGAMSAADGEGLGKAMGMKKVTVAAPDEKSLKKGLETAENLVDKMPKDDGGDTTPPKPEHNEGNDYPSTEDTENAEYDMDEMVDCLDDENAINEMMKKLEAKKASLKS